MATGRVPTTANSPLTAKGDLFGYSTTQARVAVGNDGETLVADSSTATGLRWQGNFAAGKNKFINGDFAIWQRGTSVSLTNSVRGYGADRFAARSFFSAGSSTFSQQTFTPGTAPVAGYEGQYFGRISCGSTATAWQYDQRIEDARTFAGQTVTFSFWIKASANNASTVIEVIQNFGSGGSTGVTTNATGPSVTTSWQRFSVTLAIPSVSGKTIGTGSFIEFSVYSNSGVTNSMTVDTWGWQVEAGNTATAFQTATGTLAGELAACQRYYYKHPTGANNPLTNCAAYSTTNALGIIPFRVTMRTAPTMSVVTGTNYYQIVANGGVDNINSFTQDSANTDSATIYNNTEVAQTAGHAGIFISNNASASIAWSAEL